MASLRSLVIKSNSKLCKVTKIRRSYSEGCIAAHALDLIGDRWLLLVVRELILGPRRFSALREGLPGISANVLTQKLQELETAGVITRQLLPEPARVQVYRLTGAGEDLWPVLKTLCIWGARQPGHDPRQFISPAALMLSMRATCARSRAGEHLVEMRLATRQGEECFTIRTAPGRYHLARGEAGASALQFRGDTNSMAFAVYGPAPLLVSAAGAIAFSGPPAEGQAFIDLFALRSPD